MFRRACVFMKCTWSFPRGASMALLLVGAAACSRDTPQARQSSRDTGGAATASGASGANNATLPLAARNALTEGNAAYRAKHLDVALVKYREAALAAPQHAAPWFGIYMAANEMKNTALADSAMGRVQSLSADPAALNAHATVTAANGGLESPGGGMPAGHPATKLVVPGGHPAAAKADTNKRTRM